MKVLALLLLSQMALADESKAPQTKRLKLKMEGAAETPQTGKVETLNNATAEKSEGSENKTEKEKEKIKSPGPCDHALELAQLVVDKRWKDLASSMRFPWRRSWPFKALTKEQFLENPELVFDPKMFKETVSIRQNGNLCMVNKGQLWTQDLNSGRKIIKVNYETAVSKTARISATSKQLAFAPEASKPAKVLMSCDFNGSNFMVYRAIKTGAYALVVEKAGKIEKQVMAGKFRQDDAGVRHYRFIENGTNLTVGENMRKGAYYLALKTKGGKEKFYDCL